MLLDGRYAGLIKIEHVTPEPERVVSEGGALRFYFHTTPGIRLPATGLDRRRRHGATCGTMPGIRSPTWNKGPPCSPYSLSTWEPP